MKILFCTLLLSLGMFPVLADEIVLKCVGQELYTVENSKNSHKRDLETKFFKFKERWLLDDDVQIRKNGNWVDWCVQLGDGVVEQNLNVGDRGAMCITKYENDQLIKNVTAIVDFFTSTYIAKHSSFHFLDSGTKGDIEFDFKCERIY